MHKSWGNAIDFDEAAERMGVDVMRWMFAKARPEENILFGWHAADEARRELLILWNVYAFFVTYARLAGWTPAEAGAAGRRSGHRSMLDPVARCRARRTVVEERLRDVDAVGATRALSTFIDDLSTWYLRRQPAALLATGRHRRPRRGVRDAARGAGRDLADARSDPAVPRRLDVREPGRRPSTGQRRTAST